MAGGFLIPATFTPPVYNIPLGTSGQVLTMVGGRPKFSAASGGGGIGSYLAVTAASGVSNNVNPAGFGSTVGRLGVNTNAGNAEWTGLAAGSDAQLLLIMNDGSNNLQLDSLSGSSSSANQFQLPANLILPPNDGVFLVYTAGSVNLWQIAP